MTRTTLAAAALALSLSGAFLASWQDAPAAAPPLAGPAAPAYGPKGGDSFVNGRSHEGEELDADLPSRMWFPNIGSHRDGAGMCVMTSIEMSALMQGLDQYKGLRDWCAKEAGGGYPDKVARQIPAFEKARNLKPTPFLQYEGKDVAGVLEQAARQGIQAACTYGYSPRYGSQTISHMVCCPKFSGKYAVILDNNAIGGVQSPDRLWEWMSKDEAVRRICYPSGSGWVFVWLAPPPPPLPRN